VNYEYDTNAGLDLSEPLRVFLTACEIDGSTVPCEGIRLQLYYGTLVMTPVRFREEKKQGFVVPAEFRSLKSFGVKVANGKTSADLSGIDISFLKGKWRIGIDHSPF